MFPGVLSGGLGASRRRDCLTALIAEASLVALARWPPRPGRSSSSPVPDLRPLGRRGLTRFPSRASKWRGPSNIFTPICGSL